MSDYTKATNFAAKDTLPVGDANKKVKGSEIDTEFNAISDAIATKADKNSPTFTGTPTATTAAAGTNTTQIATTAFVTASNNLKADLASPTFTGTPAAPTAATGTGTTQLATTAFVQQEITANAVADGAITTVKLAADAVTSAKIADDAVDTEHLAADAVDSAAIADNAIGAAALNVSGNGASGQYLSSDGDGTFSWETAAEVYTPSVGNNTVSTTETAYITYTHSSTSFTNSGSFTVGAGEVWFVDATGSTGGGTNDANYHFRSSASDTYLSRWGFVGPGTYYFRARRYSTLIGDNDDGTTVITTPVANIKAWRIK